MRGHSHQRNWSMPFAAHLGYRSPDAPLFLHSAASANPLDQIEFAAELGFAGMQCVFATGYSSAQQSAIGAALRRCQLQTGCMLYAPFSVIARPFLGSNEPQVRAEFLNLIRAAIEAAERVGSRHIAVLAAADPAVALDEQRARFTERLAEALELARKHQIRLCLEALASPVLPPMILARLDQAVRVVESLSSPFVRLIYDTAHVHSLEGDALAPLARVFNHIEVVQLADVPGRCEPGSGCIDFQAVLTQLRRLGFQGLIELEHQWSLPGVEGERRGLERLRQLDDRLTHPERP